MSATGDPNIPEDEIDLDAEIDLGDDWPLAVTPEPAAAANADSTTEDDRAT